MSSSVVQFFVSNAAHIPDTVLAARLEEISIMKMIDEERFCVQLIGAAQEVKLLLGPPQHDSIAVSTFAILPDTGWDVVLRTKQTVTGRLFADVGVFLNQQGLHKWRFTGSSLEVRQYGARSWVRTIFSRMAHATELFGLEPVGINNDPVIALKERLLPGRSLLQLISFCPGMSSDDIAYSQQALQEYKEWRFKAMLSRISEAMWLASSDEVEKVVQDNAAFVIALRDLIKPLQEQVMLP